MRLFLTRKLIDVFAIEALLSEEEIIILRSLAKEVSREKLADLLHISVSTLDKKIRILKQKYDYVASYTAELPERSKLTQLK